jgi:hypothetical protein
VKNQEMAELGMNAQFQVLRVIMPVAAVVGRHRHL